MPTLVKKQPQTEQEEYLGKARSIASLAAEKKAREIKGYEVAGMTVVADAFVICTVTSEPQLKAVLNGVKEGMKDLGVAPLRTEGTLQGGWVLMDYGEIIFHIFREEAREFYDLDGMWADAKAIDLYLEA